MTAMPTPSLVSATQPGTPMPLRRLLGAYATEATYESLRMLRTPAMAVPFLLLPVPIYLFFGVVLAGGEIEKNPALANYLFSGWCVFATMGPAMFGAGCALAAEREAGLVKLRRALPMPGGSWVVAKTAVAMVFAGIAVSLVVVAAVVAGRISLSAGQLLVIAAVMIVGAIPFCAISLFVGARASGASAPAYLNLIFLPMLWLSGLFFPLPGALERFVVIWPAFHLNQVALGLAGVSEFSFIPPQMAAAVLVGVTVLFGGLAIRRLARRG